MKFEGNNIIQLINQSFYTKAEFNRLLLDYAVQHDLDGISFNVTKKHEKIDRPCSYVYGTELQDQSVKMQNEIDVADSSIKIRYSIWSQQNISSETEEEVSNIIKTYLNTQNIYRSTLLPSYEHQHGDEWLDKKLEATVKRFLDTGMSVAVFMIDLDHFKDVNEQNDHSIGGSVLFEFSNLLMLCCEEKAVVIHRSGDEFFVIMPYSNSYEPLELAYQIRETVKHHSYQNVSQCINLTAAQGIWLLTDYKTSFKDVVVYAEKTYKPDGQEKHRDSVRIACLSEVVPDRELSDQDLAYAVVRSRLTDCCVFHNPYLDFISSMASQCDNKNDIQTQVNQWISWLHPEEISGMQFLSLSNDMSFICGWSSDELAFALFHGLCRNPINFGKNIHLAFNPNKNNSFSISVDFETIYLHGEKFDLIEGQGYDVKLPNCAMKECEARNTALIHIGYDPLIIPDCFYHVIRIDARPIIGGNLPDFWAGALSELINLMSEETPIKQVIVYGKKSSARKIHEILENVKNWGNESYSLSFLSKQTKQPTTSIEICKRQLIDHITFINEGDKSALIQELKRIYSTSCLEKKPPAKDRPDSHRFLQRTLSYEPIRLKIEDGCTVRTMEEAFPTVLEIIRNCESTEVMTDQAGRELKELSNFKLTITKPSSTSIPEYYWELTNDLKEYYESILGNKDGFFQKYLEEHGQYQAVLQHIVNLIDSTKLKYASRRALLVVPHKVVDQQDISPLGLVSVYISPREANGGIVFNFSFTWRTVEAIVGLPYSLYGSVKYAERLLDEIKRRLNNKKTPTLKMGNVSYMAYSLHMFLDSPYSQIVRGIINDATK